MAYQKTSRSRTALQLILVLAISAAILVFAIYLLRANPAIASRSVHFEVESSGGFSIITLRAGSVSIKVPTTVTTPWQRTVQIPSGTEVYLTASNPTQTGKLTCKISFDNQPWKNESTVAPKDGVACAGIVP